MKRYTVLTILVGLLLAFQNCSDVSFQTLSDINGQCLPPDCPIPVPPGEDFNISHTVTANIERRADILFIIDTSGSMEYEQTQIQNRFDDFVEGLTNIDWRIAMTTAIISKQNYAPGTGAGLVGNDIPGSGARLIPFTGAPPATTILTSAMDPVVASQYFKNTIRRPITCGPNIVGCDNHERGIYKANQLIDNRATHGLFRQGSNVNVIIVSDENEKSDGDDLANADRPANIIANSANLAARTFTVHSIIVKKDKPGETEGRDCLNSNDEHHTGTVYQELSELTDGVVGNVCAADYTTQLQVIADNISTTTKSFLLPCVPAGAITVGSTPQLPSSYQYAVQSNRLVFNMDLPAGTVLNIRGTCR